MARKEVLTTENFRDIIFTESSVLENDPLRTQLLTPRKNITQNEIQQGSEQATLSCNIATKANQGNLLVSSGTASV